MAEHWERRERMMRRILLGVNVDHIATIRQARRGTQPDPVQAAVLCELAGCDSIVAHLREDRRHIQERDIERLQDTVATRLNLEMSVAPSVVRIALRVKPSQATLVPERRRELTTEGGLNVIRGGQRLRRVVRALQDSGIRVSVFIDPDQRQIDAVAQLGVQWIELHTGAYANSRSARSAARQLSLLDRAAQYARRLGLCVNAGHGLNYQNVSPVCQIDGMEELNIGHAIVARASLVGLDRAVRDMLAHMGR